MERFIKGDVVVVPFPFSDLTAAKRRQALVIAELSGDDLIKVTIDSFENNFFRFSATFLILALGHAQSLFKNQYISPTRLSSR